MDKFFSLTGPGGMILAVLIAFGIVYLFMSFTKPALPTGAITPADYAKLSATDQANYVYNSAGYYTKKS